MDIKWNKQIFWKIPFGPLPCSVADEVKYTPGGWLFSLQLVYKYDDNFPEFLSGSIEILFSKVLK
jgi:hypothetical protein